MRLISAAILLFLSLFNVSYANSIKFGQNGAVLALDLPPYIAYEKGFYKQNGLQVEEPIQFKDTATLLTALAAGHIQSSNFGMFNTVQAHYNVPAIVLGRPISTAVAVLIADRDIKTVADLRGRTITIGAQFDATDFWARTILAAYGLNAKDVEWFYSPDSATRLATIEQKRSQAAVVLPPFNFVAESRGHHQIALLTDVKQIIHKTLVFNLDWAKTNPAQVQAMIRSLDQSIEWLYDPKNRDEAIDVLTRLSNINREDAAKSFDWTIKNRAFVIDPAISKSMIANFARVSKEWGTVKNNDIPVENLVAAGAKIKD